MSYTQYTFKIINTLRMLYMKKKLASGKIFSNWVCTCHCIVIFPYLLKSWKWVSVPR